MTSKPIAAIEAVISRVDWLADRGAFVMRAAAIFTWLGAVAATVIVLSKLGGIGWLLGAICLIPGWILWQYGKRLTTALDASKIRAQLDEAATLARTRLGEVVDGIQTTRRRFLRGGIKVLKTVRELRNDLDNFGIDVSDITKLANPGRITMAVGSLFTGLGLWLLAAIGAAVRFVF